MPNNQSRMQYRGLTDIICIHPCNSGVLGRYGFEWVNEIFPKFEFGPKNTSDGQKGSKKAEKH